MVYRCPEAGLTLARADGQQPRHHGRNEGTQRPYVIRAVALAATAAAVTAATAATAAAAGEEEGGLCDEDESDGIEHDDAIEGPVDPLTEEEVGERRGEHGRDVDDRGRVAWLGLGLGLGLGSESV